MSQNSQSDYTRQLRSLMQQAGVSSFKELSRVAGVSEWQVRQLRQGNASQMQVEPLHKLSQALNVSLVDLLGTFSELPFDSLKPAHASQATAIEDAAKPEEVELLDPLIEGTTLADRLSEREAQLNAEIAGLKDEYQRLQQQLADHRSLLHQEFLQSSLQVLESLLLQLPTAIYAAQQNPEVPASRLLPLLRPLEQLLRSWGIETIAPVGTELAFNPSLHQLMEGTANPGDRVKVRYTGYLQGSKLLYRAKVSPVTKAS